ncbi:TPA: hypothetical protein U0583_000700 [Streptococcus suis]|nr:hypothetical protein [Streptococcus suis]
MNQELINQALRLAIDELTSKLAEELTTKNLLSAQLTEAQQTIANLQAENADLLRQLDEVTKPEEVAE